MTRLFSTRDELLVGLLIVVTSMGCTSARRPIEDDRRQSLCDYATIDSEGIAHVSIEDYCDLRDCGGERLTSIDTFQSQFRSCEQPERLEPESLYTWCPVTRYRGCGMVQFEEVLDESSYTLWSYSEDTRKLIGVYFASDFPLRNCAGATTPPQIGTNDPQLPTNQWTNVCEEIELHKCCIIDEEH